LKNVKLILVASLLAYLTGAVFWYGQQNTFRQPAHVDPVPKVEKKERLRLVLVGDTGMPGAQRDRVRKRILHEEKDYIIALGDLVYPHPPPCPTGEVSAEDLPFYEERVARGIEGLRAPVLAILGNHAYYRGKRSLMGKLYPFVPTTLELGDAGEGRVIDPAACMVDFIGTRPQIHLPGLDYALDFGVAQIAFVDTDHLDDKAAKVVDQAFATGTGWKVLMGHHVLRTYHDKADENYVAPWLSTLKTKPDLYANGHAHVMQFGIYDDVPAVTSGTGSKIRHRPACPPACGEGQIFGVSAPGYALLEIEPKRMTVTFKDDNGSVRYRWSVTR
jgi:predicted phosphodiesterase